MRHICKITKIGQIAEQADENENKNGREVDPDDFSDKQKNRKSQQAANHAHFVVEDQLFHAVA